MKMIIANNLYFPYERGGAEKVARLQAEELRAAGHEVKILTTRASGAVSGNEEGIIYVPSRYSGLNRLPYFLRFFWHLSDIFFGYAYFHRLLLIEGPDVLITHNLTGIGWQLPKAARRLKIRHEHYLHDIQLLHPSGLMIFGRESIITSLPSRLYQSVMKKLIASPAKVYSPSKWLFDLHRAKGFFPVSEFELRRSSTKEIPETTAPAKNFLFLGQVEEHKGVFILIDAFKEALRSAPDIKLQIAGDGSSLEDCKQMAEGTFAISFPGRLDKEGVDRAIRASDCLIVPSICYENAPASILEAHALGKPVIASELGGIPELLSKADVLVAPADTQALSKVIIDRSRQI